MSKYSSIHKYIKQQKRLYNKINKLHWKAQSFRNKRRAMQAPFWGGDLDVELYKDFFKHYCIQIRHPDSHSRYVVTDIVLDAESTPAARKFWKAQYDFKQWDKDNNIQDEHKGSLSLRGIIDILMQPFASLQKL